MAFLNFVSVWAWHRLGPILAPSFCLWWLPRRFQEICWTGNKKVPAPGQPLPPLLTWEGIAKTGAHPVTSDICACVYACVCLCVATPPGFSVFEACKRLHSELNYEFLQRRRVAGLREESWVGCKIKLTPDTHGNPERPVSPCSPKEGCSRAAF